MLNRQFSIFHLFLLFIFFYIPGPAVGGGWQSKLCPPDSAPVLSDQVTAVISSSSSALSRVASGEPVEVKLEDLASLDVDPKGSLKTLSELKELLTHSSSISPSRKTWVRHLIKVLLGYQFESAQFAREVVANALDSYYSTGLASTESKKVEVTTHEGVIQVVDHGVGMNLKDVVFYLLTPGRSKNRAVLLREQATEGVTGKFGQGFFSVLGYLQSAKDSIQITTRTREDGPIILKLFKSESNEIHVKIETAPESVHSGTEIVIRSDTLREPGLASAQEAVQQAFEFNDRGEVEMNHHRVNPLLRTEPLLVETETSRHPTLTDLPKWKGRIWVTPPGATVADGSGELVLTVNGVAIQRIQHTGLNIYKQVVLDLPSQVPLTPSRNILDLKDPEMLAFIKQIFHQAALKQDVTLLNSLYPILGERAERILPQLELPLTTSVVSASNASLGQMKYRGETIQLLHPNLYKITDGKSKLKSVLGMEHSAAVIPVSFNDPQKNFEIVDQYPRPLIFISEAVDLKSPWIPSLLNQIQEAEARVKKGQSTLKWMAETELVMKSSNSSRQGGKVGPADLSHFPAFDLKVFLGTEDDCGSDPEIFKKEPTLSELKLIHQQAVELCRLHPDYEFDFCLNFSLRMAAEISHKENFPCERINIESELFYEGVSTGIPLAELTRQLRAVIQKTPTSIFIELSKLYSSISLEKKDDRSELVRHVLSDLSSKLIGGEGAILKEVQDIGEFIKLFRGEALRYLRIPLDVPLERIVSAIKARLPEGIEQVDFTREYDEFLDSLRVVRAFKSQETPQNGSRPNALDWKYIQLCLEIYSVNEENLELILSLPDEKRFNHVLELRQLVQFRDLTKGALRRLVWQGLGRSDDWPDPEVEKAYEMARSQFVKNIISQMKESDRPLSDLGEKLSLTNRLIEHNWAPFHRFKPRTVQELFNQWHDAGVINEDTLPLIVLFLYSDVIRPEKLGTHYSGDIPLLSKVAPLVHHSKVKEIMGSQDEELVRKNIYLAVHQNPNPVVWVNELVKNSTEAGATQLKMELYTDDHGSLVMDFADNGKGVSADTTHSFFIPKFTEKEKSAGDVNFGWGFFTLFKFFDEVVVDTSQNGVHHQLIHLVFKDDEIHIKEVSRTHVDGAEDSSSELQGVGTRISARRKKPFSPLETAEIYSHFLWAASGLPEVASSFNGKDLNERHLRPLRAENLLVKEPFFERHPDGSQVPGHIEIYQSNKPGVYYNQGKFFSSDLSEYLKGLPKPITEQLEKLPFGIAIHLNASLQQNMGRTGFNYQSQWAPQVRRATMLALESLVKRATLDSPKTFDLPYDFFYEMASFRDHEGSEPGSDWIQRSAHDEAFIKNLIHVKLYEGGPSLHEVRTRVRKYLKDHGVLSVRGEYQIPTPEFNLLPLITEPKLEHVIETFNLEISKHLSIMRKQKHSPLVDHSDVLDDLSHDVNSEVMATRYPDRAPSLYSMEKWVETLVKKVFDKEIHITFYDAVDSSAAHAHQAGNTIGINIKGNLLNVFEEIEQGSRTQNSGVMLLLNAITHELTHIEESPGQETHNLHFSREQQMKLNRLFRINHNDILAVPRVNLRIVKDDI